jgi:hypothetical protein
MPTIRQKKAFKKTVENGGNVSKAMKESDYSAAMAKNPQKLTTTKGWKELMDQYLPDKKLMKVHNKMLGATYVDHMVFPLNVTDDEIKTLLKSVNCTVRKFMHSETQTHVWYWSCDNKARKDALDMAYKLKGSYAPDKSVNVNLNAELNKTNPKLKALVDQFEEKLRKEIEQS